MERDKEITSDSIINENEKPIANIEMFTQKSEEDEKEDEDVYDCDSYKEYENHIEKLSSHKLPYATKSVDDEDEERHCFAKLVKRKPEPLYVGDTIEYNRFMDGLNPGNFYEAMVVSIDRRERW